MAAAPEHWDSPSPTGQKKHGRSPLESQALHWLKMQVVKTAGPGTQAIISLETLTPKAPALTFQALALVLTRH
jgi:hypothetical protein